MKEVKFFKSCPWCFSTCLSIFYFVSDNRKDNLNSIFRNIFCTNVQYYILGNYTTNSSRVGIFFLTYLLFLLLTFIFVELVKYIWCISLEKPQEMWSKWFHIMITVDIYLYYNKIFLIIWIARSTFLYSKFILSNDLIYKQMYLML